MEQPTFQPRTCIIFLLILTTTLWIMSARSMKNVQISPEELKKQRIGSVEFELVEGKSTIRIKCRKFE